MNNIKFTDNELHLMSYQELRRLSILLRLPANIKKKYMISMIQAHQKGDGCTKTAIANKIMEERKVKKLSNKGKQTKPFLMVATTSTQQIPTDLSVSTKHEVETRFSYVAHFTSKENASSGISRIIKEETEVSRRNRSILQQPRKSSRELSAIGRTEIMLPRNHSLTTPVRVMPQFERGYSTPNQYETAQGLSNPKTHFQDGGSYNYHFHGEYSNTMIPSSNQELHRSEPYWHTREMYNNSLMPILSSLLSPVSINSSTNASHYSNPGGGVAAPPSFQQNIYEKYIKNGNIMENQTLQSGSSNSTVVITNPFSDDNNNSYNVSHGRYIITKNDVDFEINSALDDITYQQYNKRDDTVIRQANGSQAHLADFYFPQYADSSGSPQLLDQTGNAKKLTDRFKVENNSTELHMSQETFRMSNPTFRKNDEMNDSSAKHIHLTSPLPPPPPPPPLPAPLTDGANEYETICSDEEKFWEDPKRGGENKSGKDSLEEGSREGEGGRNSFLSVISENSSDCYGETDTDDFCDKKERSENQICMHQSFSRCRYVLGHNKYPEAVDKRNEMLPSFLSTFYTYGVYNKAYSFCRNSFTGTTETHLSPIMTSTCSSQFIPHKNTQITHSSEKEQHQISRPWLYLPPESQPPPFSVESTSYPTWSEYPDEMVNKVISHDGNHEVQVVKCRKHGCHYLYSVSNP